MPTETGLYWFKPDFLNLKKNEFLVVQVAKTRNGSLVGEVLSQIKQLAKTKPINNFSGKWFGPLREPTIQ